MIKKNLYYSLINNLKLLRIVFSKRYLNQLRKKDFFTKNIINY